MWWSDVLVGCGGAPTCHAFHHSTQHESRTRLHQQHATVCAHVRMTQYLAECVDAQITANRQREQTVHVSPHSALQLSKFTQCFKSHIIVITIILLISVSVMFSNASECAEYLIINIIIRKAIYTVTRVHAKVEFHNLQRNHNYEFV